jgi:DNA-binding transcriptional ArsR family regulator
MRPRFVPWPVLAATLILLLAAPVLAAGGASGEGYHAGGGVTAGGGGQSYAMDGPSFSGSATASGQAATGSTGDRGFDGSSPAGYDADLSSDSGTVSPGILLPGEPSYPAGGNGSREPSSAGNSAQDPTGRTSPEMAAGANREDFLDPSRRADAQEHGGEGPYGANGAGTDPSAGYGESVSDREGARMQAQSGETVAAEGHQAGPGSGLQSEGGHEAGYAPGWSGAGAGIVTDTSVLAGESAGPTGMNGRGKGGANRPEPLPGHVPYGEVPFGHIPYGPNPAATAVSSAPPAHEEPRRSQRPRHGEQASIEVTTEEPGTPSAFPLVFPPILPLGYRRIFGKNVLANPSRKQIYEHICRHPGTDLSGITGACGMNRETVRYHLRQLAFYHKVTLLSSDGNTRYFQNHGLFSKVDQMVIHHLEKGTSGEILRYISDHHGSTRQDIAEYLGIAGPTVSRHLATLAGEGLVLTKKEGKFLRCYLGKDVILPGSLACRDVTEPQKGTCKGS